jgi:hypothetical protein
MGRSRGSGSGEGVPERGGVGLALLRTWNPCSNPASGVKGESMPGESSRELSEPCEVNEGVAEVGVGLRPGTSKDIGLEDAGEEPSGAEIVRSGEGDSGLGAPWLRWEPDAGEPKSVWMRSSGRACRIGSGDAEDSARGLTGWGA